MLGSGLNAITSALGTGVGAGIIAGPGLGIAAGASSLAAGIGDQFLAEKRYGEQLDYTKDMFAFNNANIQARPNTLTGSGTSTVANHIRVYAEVFKATDDELTAWNKYALYNAWTLNKISTLSTMRGNIDASVSKFIKGTLCRCSVHEDSHFVNEINYELMRGVYIEHV